MENYIGRLLDNRYEILEVIGTGGMAVVYKALCHRLNRMVAIKILKDEFSKDEEFRRRFHAESQAVAMLSHPNIVSVYDVSRSGDIDYIVMELIEGITLKQYMDKKSIINWRESLHFSMQIAKALEHAHSRGIVHRDIKPHNIMILKDGSVKVADFGIARIVSSQSTLTREALGSVHYISPEQAKGSRVDNRADLYSLGVVMYQMLTGKPPYDGETPVAVAIQHINGNLLPPCQLNSSIPKGLEQIILKSMEVELDKRYDSATDMLRDMEEFRKNPAIIFGVAVQPAAVAPVRRTAKNLAEQKAGYAPNREQQRTAPAKKKSENNNLPIIIAIVACAVVLIGLITFLIYQFKDSPAPKGEPTKSTSDQQLHTVPQFVGKMYDEINLSDYDYLTFEIEKEVASEEEGMIIRQSLDAGSEIKGTRQIKLTVSSGKKSEKLPDVVHMTRADAEKSINNLKLDIIIRVEEVNDDKVESGLVIRTEPAANSDVSSGDTVKLYISKGKDPVEVPKVTGMTISNAISLLTSSSYNLKADYEYVEDAAEKDTVIAQSISQGTSVEEGTTIKLTVSQGPKETEPPEPQPVTLSYTVPLSDHPEEAFTVSVEDRESGEIVFSTEVEAGVNECVVTLTGTGTKVFRIYTGDGYKDITVNFDTQKIYG